MGYSAKSMRARLLIGAAAGALVISASPAFAQETWKVELAPQSLASALYEFGRQTGHQVIFSPELTRSKNSCSKKRLWMKGVLLNATATAGSVVADTAWVPMPRIWIE